jgi:hypothetical protein
MPYFSSSAIERAEYDEASRRLTIWFSGGRSYDYFGVPLHVWLGLLAAGSKGAYFNRAIAGRY